MAVVNWSKVAGDGRNYLLIKWDALGASDTGQPFVCAEYSDKSVQIEGADLTSGITIQGSLDSDPSTATYRTLNDPQGNALSAITTAKIENILEHCMLIRPSCGASVSGGTVWLLMASMR